MTMTAAASVQVAAASAEASAKPGPNIQKQRILTRNGRDIFRGRFSFTQAFLGGQARISNPTQAPALSGLCMRRKV